MLDSHLQKGQDPEILLATIEFVLARSRPQNKREADKYSVLCVEDEASQLQMRQMLFQTEDVDAVVLDYWLSGMNGTAVAEEMKRLSPRTPIIMLSGYSSIPGEDTVVDAWLRKASIEPEDLLAHVSRLIDLSRENGIPGKDDNADQPIFRSAWISGSRDGIVSGNEFCVWECLLN